TLGAIRRSRLLYTAVVRPTILYSAQIWGTRDNGNLIVKNLVRPLQKTQNQCLRKIIGAYKRTPTAAIKREIAVPLITLYID
ncbi:hypothetical protein K469DRAFT_648369, partial [Zopfia rhizophila CBS 207.26]